MKQTLNAFNGGVALRFIPLPRNLRVVGTQLQTAQTHQVMTAPKVTTSNTRDSEQHETRTLENAVVAHVNCPMDMGSALELQANHQAALNLFKNQCPAVAHVSSVIGIRGRGKEKCTWRVQYTRNMAPEFINIAPDELVRRISINHPNNTRIIKEYRIPYPPAIEIAYSVYCGCGESVYARMTIKKSVSVETINEDFVTLKVEENI